MFFKDVSYAQQSGKNSNIVKYKDDPSAQRHGRRFIACRYFKYICEVHL